MMPSPGNLLSTFTQVATVLKYNFEVLVLSAFISCYFLLLLCYILEGNIVLFTNVMNFVSDFALRF